MSKENKKSFFKTKNVRKNNQDGLVTVRIKTHSDKNKGHPHIIYGDIGNKHVSIGLTSNPKKGKNSTNYKCERNPLSCGKQSYMKRQGTVDFKKKYKGERIGKMTIRDYDKAKQYGEKAKKKYLKK